MGFNYQITQSFIHYSERFLLFFFFMHAEFSRILAVLVPIRVSDRTVKLSGMDNYWAALCHITGKFNRSSDFLQRKFFCGFRKIAALIRSSQPLDTKRSVSGKINFVRFSDLFQRFSLRFAVILWRLRLPSSLAASCKTYLQRFHTCVKFRLKSFNIRYWTKS